MQLTCDRNLFTQAFQSAAAAVPSRTPKDVLRNVYMNLNSSGAELVGTDQEVAIRFRVDGVTTNSTGEVLLPTQKVSSILRELRDDQFEIDVEAHLRNSGCNSRKCLKLCSRLSEILCIHRGITIHVKCHDDRLRVTPF